MVEAKKEGYVPQTETLDLIAKNLGGGAVLDAGYNKNVTLK